ncbi:hypothetical protein Mame01_49800 [Microbispora amethystogenes]|nr:hypothetical protein Mame01_49800 [Microbispora amethystogenes]
MRALNTRGVRAGAASGVPGAAEGATDTAEGATGGSATTTWQLVPPMPNELTPATSRAPSRGHSPPATRTDRPQPSKSISGFGSA